MNLKTETLEAVKSLLQHKLRTALTLLGMIFGVGAVISMLSIGKGAEKESLKLIESLGIKNIIVKERKSDIESLNDIRKKSSGLTLQDLNAVYDTLPFIRTCSALKKLTVYSIFSMHNKCKAEVFGVSHMHFKIANLQLSTGRFFNEKEEDNFVKVCVIGNRVALRLFPKNNAVGKHIKINHTWIKIIGILKNKNYSKNDFEGITLKSIQNSIFIPLLTIIKMFKFKALESEIDEFRVKLDENTSSGSAAIALTHLMNRRHKNIPDFDMIVPEALLEQHRKTQNIFNIVMASIAGISLLVGGIGIMNIMLATVLERTKEIGLRRALGAKQKDIRRQFIFESMAISGIGGIFGIVFGIALSLSIAYFAKWPVGWSYKAVILSFGFCAFIGLIFGIYPAVQASKLNPIEALRHD